MVRDKIAKIIAVDGVYPDSKTIKNKTYPYTTEVYAVIRSDLDKSSIAYRIYELLLSEAGQPVIAESGYIPN
jgi:phosphate transport system substrate-binding protein